MSDHNVISPEVTFAPEHAADTKVIWRTFWLLSALTVIELTIGLTIYNIKLGGEEAHASVVLAFKGMVCILTLAKAYYIVSVFMHLGSEVRNLIMTIVVPLCLFIWFITAFLVDGNSWKTLRNRYNRPADMEQAAPAPKEVKE
ncbi:MAG TPA: cytochrome C oxidase subunit IV family protein [Ferruginibacter sp.]|jgi:cytochrome c oxidase subunit 4|nr:cytochrome C oxidase subunit IV family protein [Ferruginibacter sp.]